MPLAMRRETAVRVAVPSTRNRAFGPRSRAGAGADDLAGGPREPPAVGARAERRAAWPARAAAPPRRPTPGAWMPRSCVSTEPRAAARGRPRPGRRCRRRGRAPVSVSASLVYHSPYRAAPPSRRPRCMATAAGTSAVQASGRPRAVSRERGEAGHRADGVGLRQQRAEAVDRAAQRVVLVQQRLDRPGEPRAALGHRAALRREAEPRQLVEHGARVGRRGGGERLVEVGAARRTPARARGAASSGASASTLT